MIDKQKRPPYEIALMHDHILRLEEELKAKEQTIIKIKNLIDNTCKICKDFESRICKYCNYNKIMNIINEVDNE
jgi:hypothetical protein